MHLGLVGLGKLEFVVECRVREGEAFLETREGNVYCTRDLALLLQLARFSDIYNELEVAGGTDDVFIVGTLGEIVNLCQDKQTDGTSLKV